MKTTKSLQKLLNFCDVIRFDKFDVLHGLFELMNQIVQFESLLIVRVSLHAYFFRLGLAKSRSGCLNRIWVQYDITYCGQITRDRLEPESSVRCFVTTRIVTLEQCTNYCSKS